MPKNTARAIDNFFRKHNSPVAGLGKFFVQFSQHSGVNPYQLAAIVMKETEGGLTGTGRRGQYNLTGMGGVGHMRSYPNYRSSIRASARNLGGPLYKGKNLAQQSAMWVEGGKPSATSARYTQDIKQFMRMMGARPGASTGIGSGVPGGGGRPGKPGRPATPGLPAIPGVPGVTMQNPTEMLQSLGDIMGVPWSLELPDVKLPSIPGQPATPGKPGKPGTPGMPGGGRGGLVKPVKTKMGGSDFAYVDAEGAPDRNGTRHHAAHDWFGVEGKLTPVMAPVNGKIIESRQATTWSGQVMGGTIKVLAPDGKVFVFRHVIPGLKVGQRVKAGQQLARIGRWTDGADHTHVEIWKTLKGGYRYENMIDPVKFFQGGGAAPAGGGGGKPGTLPGFKTMENAINTARKRGLTVKENPYVDPVDPSQHVEHSYHIRTYPGNKGVGQAADVYGTPAQMAAYWRYIKKRYPNVTQLFYSPMGFLSNGKPTTLPDNLVKSHYSHVHVAFGPGRYK